MSINLFGEFEPDAKFYAKKLIGLGVKLPFLKLEFLPDYIDNRMHMNVYNDGEKVSLSDAAGYYAIYHKHPLLDVEDPIYAGVSEGSIRYRLYRFGIDLCGIADLRDSDSHHSGAKRYRQMGGTRDNLYVKYILFDDIKFEIPNNMVATLDEYIAGILNTKCNKRKRK